jgi:chemotaxis signal transduction protein
MSSARQDRLPFVIFELRGGLYAVGSKNVREIVMMPPVTEVANIPPEVRGVINLRGKIIKLIDLRVKLGLPPLKTEVDALIQLLRDREQELARLINLFAEARGILLDRCHEAMVVLSRGDDRSAFSADLVEAVEQIPDEQIEPMPVTLTGVNLGRHCRVGKRSKTNQTILLLGDEFFFGQSADQPWAHN